MGSFGSRMRALVFIFLISVLTVYSCVTVIRAENAVKEHRAARAEAITRMQRGFDNYEESIDISDLAIAPNELGGLFSDATKDTPYLFYVSNNLAYTYRTDGCVVTVRPGYTMERAQAEAAVEYCKAEIKKMAELLACRETELERLVGAHDLICHRFSYDISLQSNNIYTFLKTGTGTCQGYTWAYMALLRELGIECRYVASDTVAHIWLMVKIDGEWYHSDVTWDDPPSNEKNGNRSRAHLLFSDEKADRDGYTDRYGALDIRCESTEFDGKDLLLDIPFCTLSGDVDHDGRITVCDLLRLRLFVSYKNVQQGAFCRVCADVSENLSIDEKDADMIRWNILDGRVG